jgi:hypothetical protein
MSRTWLLELVATADTRRERETPTLVVPDNTDSVRSLEIESGTFLCRWPHGPSSADSIGSRSSWAPPPRPGQVSSRGEVDIFVAALATDAPWLGQTSPVDGPGGSRYETDGCVRWTACRLCSAAVLTLPA